MALAVLFLFLLLLLGTVRATIVQTPEESFAEMFSDAALTKADKNLFRCANFVRYQTHVGS